jgi:hypothetical protein
LIIDESFDDVLMEGLVLLIVFGLLGPVVGEHFVDIFAFEKKKSKKNCFFATMFDFSQLKMLE